MCSINYGISLDSERSGAQFIMQAGILLGHADTVTDGIHWKGFLFVVLGIPFELAIFRVTDGERQSTEYKTRSVHNFLVFCKVIVVGWIYKRMSDKLYQTGGAKACWKWHLRKLGGGSNRDGGFFGCNSLFIIVSRFICICFSVY